MDCRGAAAVSVRAFAWRRRSRDVTCCSPLLLDLPVSGPHIIDSVLHPDWRIEAYLTWERTKANRSIFYLGLHTRGQRPTDDAFQNVDMATLFVSFGINYSGSGREFVQDKDENSNSFQVDKFFFPFQTYMKSAICIF
jgi:hypothetical protein